MNALIILFYRIVTVFTRVPAKTRAKHKDIISENKSIFSSSGKPLVLSQNGLDRIPFGKGDMFKNGCGPIALYNAMLLLDERLISSPVLIFQEIVDYLERRGIAFSALLGTSPIAILNFLKTHGYTVDRTMTTSPEKLNIFSKKFDTFISVFYNNAKSIKYGLHFVCIKKEKDNTFSSINPGFTGTTLFDTLSMCSEHKIKNVYTIGIKR